jgi:transposase-like protein
MWFMDEYPMDLIGFEKAFETEEQCRRYLFKLRWGDKFICPRCRFNEVWQISDVKYKCRNCGYQTSVIAGTIFQDTHKPLTLWFRAIWYITSQKSGASALGLQPILGLGSYRTVWTWLHKLRRAMVRPGRDKIGGVVEVDEAYIGAPETKGKRGRGTENKALIVIAVEISDRKVGRIRMGIVENASTDNLHTFIESTVDKGSTIVTDGWSGYVGITEKGYYHKIQITSKKAEDAPLAHVHIVISLLKRWLLGTLHGSWSREHLAYYLDEFTFRFNRRKSKSRGMLFYRLLQNAVQIEPVVYNRIIGKL